MGSEMCIRDSPHTFFGPLLTALLTILQPQSHAPAPIGPQYEMLHGIPIWHGLMLAGKILGDDMPQRQTAEKVIRDYEAGLTILAQAIEAEEPRPASYGAQALDAWRDCIRD